MIRIQQPLFFVLAGNVGLREDIESGGLHALAHGEEEEGEEGGGGGKGQGWG